MKVPEDIMVVGTDTDVGKTVVSLLLMQLLFTRGYQPCYFKPFQTGCAHPSDGCSDAKFIYTHTKALEGQDPSRSTLYCHAGAKAPYFAARDAGQALDISAVQRYVAEQRKRYAPLVIEAAGGLMVPVTQKVLWVDLIAGLACRPLLVARPGLGTINHTLLSIEALRQRSLEPMGVVFVETSASPTSAQLIADNIEAIQTHTRITVAGVIDHLTDFKAPPASAYAPLAALLP